MAEYEKTILPNGLRVIKSPMPHLHSAVAAVYVKAGPRFEPRDLNGISHFVEHMIFKGTPQYPDPIRFSEALSRIGAEINASTMAEHSEIALTTHSKYFVEGLALLADMLLQPLFDAGQIERERPVIANEMARDFDDTGETMDIDEISYELMWPEVAYSFNILGRPENIERFTRDDLTGHYERFYTPENMVLSIAGNFGADGLDDRLAELFGSIKRPAHRPEAVTPALQERPLSQFRHAHTQTSHIKLCHKACSYRDPNLATTLVLNDLLGGGVSSRLFSVLRETEGLVYDISSAPSLLSDVGSIDVYTSTTSEHVVRTVDAVLDVMDQIAGDGINDGELETYKQRVACHLDLLLDSPVEMSEWYGVRELLIEPETLETTEQEAARLRAVTNDDIVNMARDVFAPDRRSLVVVGPCGWTQRRKIRKSLTRPAQHKGTTQT